MVKLAQISVIKWCKYSIRLRVRKFNQWFDQMVNRECVHVRKWKEGRKEHVVV